jgi:DNA polymerase-3 subunit beta
MELTIPKDPLLKLLNRTQSVAIKTSTMPILGYALLVAEADTLTISATDLEISVITGCPAEVKESGRVAIGARKLFDVCKSLPNGAVAKIKLNPATNQATLTSGRSRFVLAGVDGVEFPELPNASQVVPMVISAGVLAGMIGKVQFAVSTETGRETLMSALLQSMPGSILRMVATDTLRMAMTDKPITGLNAKINAMIPSRALAEIAKMLKEDSSTEIKLIIGGSAIQIIRPGYSMICKLTAGKYPNYARIIPDVKGPILTVDREALQSTVKRMGVLSSERSQAVLLELEQNKITIRSENPEQEQGEEELDVEYQGPKMTVGFNVRYLLDMLNVMTGAVVRFIFKDDESAVIVADPADEGSVFVLMPVRL